MRLLRWSCVALAFLWLAGPVAAQVEFGVQSSVITGVDDTAVEGQTLKLSGSYGVGGRVIVRPPALPVALVGAGDYYFVDCIDAVDCSLWTVQGHAQIGLSMPAARPYVLAGYQYRHQVTLYAQPGGSRGTTTGAVIGAGVEVHLGLSLFLEGQLEMADINYQGEGESPDLGAPFVIKGGIIF